MTKLRKMKLLATSMVFFMAILFCVSHLSLESWSGFVWVLAFSEAALVGALADWFAVVALFKHPLGIPIPHTAIIPNNRDRLATALSSFVGEYLLSPEWLMKQIEEKELLKKALNWLSEEDNIRSLSKQLSSENSLKESLSISQRTNESIRNSLQAVSWSNPLSELVNQVTVRRAYQEPLGSLLASLSAGLKTQKSWANQEVKKEAPLRNLPLLGKVSRSIASRFSDKAVDKLTAYLEEAGKDPEHSFYEQVDSYLLKLSQDLKEGTYDPNLKELKGTLLHSSNDSQITSDFIKKVSSEIDYSTILSIYLSDNARELTSSPEKLDEFSQKITTLLHPLLSSITPKLTSTMHQAILRFDEKNLSQTIEEKVGADLQFIRINGTLVGGLIGIFLHFLKVSIL